ncbi:MAG: hypothetical protein QXO17_07330 [Nitrososphaerota archaeon]|nr:hypothetical protein [Candidatus Calditenuis fumarioli]
MYGDETALKPPSALFRREDALEALRRAEEAFGLCRRLVTDWTS